MAHLYFFFVYFYGKFVSFFAIKATPVQHQTIANQGKFYYVFIFFSRSLFLFSFSPFFFLSLNPLLFLSFFLSLR